jgi:hypothetical protein
MATFTHMQSLSTLPRTVLSSPYLMTWFVHNVRKPPTEPEHEEEPTAASHALPATYEMDNPLCEKPTPGADAQTP